MSNVRPGSLKPDDAAHPIALPAQQVLTPEDAQALFQRWDLDHDNVLSKSELIQVLADIYPKSTPEQLEQHADSIIALCLADQQTQKPSDQETDDSTPAPSQQKPNTITFEQFSSQYVSKTPIPRPEVGFDSANFQATLSTSKQRRFEDMGNQTEEQLFPSTEQPTSE